MKKNTQSKRGVKPLNQQSLNNKTAEWLSQMFQICNNLRTENERLSMEARYWEGEYRKAESRYNNVVANQLPKNFDKKYHFWRKIDSAPINETIIVKFRDGNVSLATYKNHKEKETTFGVWWLPLFQNYE